MAEKILGVLSIFKVLQNFSEAVRKGSGNIFWRVEGFFQKPERGSMWRAEDFMYWRVGKFLEN